MPSDDDDQDPEADADDKDDVDADDDETETDKEQAAYQRGLAMGRTRENKRCSRIFLARRRCWPSGSRRDAGIHHARTDKRRGPVVCMSIAGAAATSRAPLALDDRMANRN